MAGPARHPVVVLLDVDNTLLDNDRIIADLGAKLEQEVGHARAAEYWAIFERIRSEIGYADYLGTLQQYRAHDPHDHHLPAISSFLLEYPFRDRLFPGALEVIWRLGGAGPTVILTDGDVVFQPHKIARSGLRDAVGDRVLIYVHKEQELADVEERFPADHYVMVDDKLRLLTAIKRIWGDRVTTVFPRQGHYAMDPAIAQYPAPDVTVEHLAELLELPLPFLPGPSGERRPG